MYLPSSIKIKIICEESTYVYEVDSLPFSLRDLSSFKDCPINFSCSDSHCYCCLIEIIEGSNFFNPPSKRELEILASLGSSSNERLACLSKVSGDITIRPVMI